MKSSRSEKRNNLRDRDPDDFNRRRGDSYGPSSTEEHNYGDGSENVSRVRKAETMPRGSKASYTSKQKRQASHVEKSAKKSGKSSKRAAEIAYATVNKQSQGGKKSGSGRGKTESHASSRKGGRKASSEVSHATRVRAGKKAAKTRQQHLH